MGFYRIVVADDHAPFRRILTGVLSRSSDLKVVGEASDGLELLQFLDANRLDPPQMVLLDISMPNLNGIEALQKMKEQYPDIKVLILTIHTEIEYFYQAILAGAMGYLLKDEVDANLFSAIETIRQRRIYVSPNLTKDLENGFRPDWFENG